MFPWNSPLIFLSLLGGYVFLDWCIYTRLRHQRLDANRLIIESVFAGTVLAGIASFIFGAFERPNEVASIVLDNEGYFAAATVAFTCCTGLLYFYKFPSKEPRHYPERLVKSVIACSCAPATFWIIVWLCDHPARLTAIELQWNDLVKLDYAGIAVTAFLLGVLGSLLINVLSDYNGIAVFIAKQEGDYLLSLCYQAAQLEQPLTIILSNKRAYLGYVYLSPNLKPESQLSLIVAIQGCLDKDSSTIKWEVNYLPQWENNAEKAKDFVVTIPTRLIEHAHVAQEPNGIEPEQSASGLA